ncbi:MAG: NAD-dependent deacylase [Anaerolineales bacterium]
MSKPLVEIPAELANILRRAQRLTVLTGAGISAESGVPTFREAQTGLWARFRPEELATPAAYQRDPRLVWEWYAWRRELTAKAQPNPGHLALAEIERHIPHFSLITQNVDGLHQRAGSRQVLELHGNIQRVKCMDGNHLVENWEDSVEIPPRCPLCGSLLRPDVVWFGENLPVKALQAAWDAAETADIFLSIGTSTQVEPAASLPFAAKRCGAVIVEVNPQETPLTKSAQYSLRGRSGVVLPALVQPTWG